MSDHDRRVTLTVDVPTIMEQLGDAGVDDATIMQRCGLKSRSGLYAWRSGDKAPRLLPGLRLLLLHLDVCPKYSPLRTLIDISSASRALTAHTEPDQGAHDGDAEDQPHTEPDRSDAGS